MANELRERGQQLDAALKELQGARRSAQEQLTKLLRRQFNARARLLQIVTIAFAHDPSALGVLAWYLVKSHPGMFDAPVQERVREIEDRFLDASPAEVAEWLDWEGQPHMHAKYREVRHLLVEVRLVRWIDTQNVVQGLSPPPALVRQQRESFMRELGLNPRGLDTRTFPDSLASIRWLQRFGRRWAFQLGRQRVTQILPVQVMQDKVLRQLDSGCVTFLVPPSDFFWQPNLAQNLGPVLGPRCRFAIKEGAISWPHFRAHQEGKVRRSLTCILPRFCSPRLAPSGSGSISFFPRCPTTRPL